MDTRMCEGLRVTSHPLCQERAAQAQDFEVWNLLAPVGLLLQAWQGCTRLLALESPGGSDSQLTCPSFPASSHPEHSLRNLLR